MNLAGLKAALTKNKIPLGIGGAVVVGALALRAKSKASSAAPAAGTLMTSGTTPISAYSSGSQTYASSPYSSTAADVVNALQPQIEQILNQQTKPPIPVPAPPAPATPVTSQGFFRRAGSAAVYQAQSNGTLNWLDAASYAGAGKPKYTDLAPTDPLWSRPVSGTDAPAWAKTGTKPS